MSALADLSSAALAGDPADPAIEFEQRWLTWGEIGHVARQVSDLIEASACGRSGRVGFVARNRPGDLAAFLGMLARGCTIRMIYPFQSPEAIAREIERVRPSVLVAGAEDYSEPLLGALRDQGAAAIALAGMAAGSAGGLERCAAAQDGDSAPAIEILTSGTTGPPKAFSLSHDMIARHIAAAATVQFARRGNQAAPLAPPLLYFPVSNISGLHSVLPPLLMRQPVVLLERFSVAGWHDHVLRFRPRFSGLPPAGIQMVLDADIPPADLACLQGIGTGAAPLDPAVQRAFEQRYGVPILLSYGATEFGGPVTRMTPELHAAWGDRKPGSVGRALEGVQLRVIDADTGAVLPPGREGILEVVSPRIGPHWIRTADIAVLDADGFLFHRGRADGAIVRGGFKLLPGTIENALLLHPAVAAAAVVGIPDHRLGQVPAALIALKPGARTPAVAALEKHLREHLPATHIPVSWRFAPELPRTPSMKVDQPAVRRLFEPGAVD